MDLDGRRVFVTGGSGVIGRTLVPRLVQTGAIVIVGDLKPADASWPVGVLHRQGDLVDLTPAELDAINPDAIVHLAATFERSAETPGFWDENYHHNIRLSHHLMSLCRDRSTLKRVVFASSYLCYDPALYLGAVEPRALREGDPLRPRNLVGMAKLLHEAELAFLAASGVSFTSVSVRIFRGYGRGSRDYLSRTIRAALVGEAVTAYSTDGEFDYVFADDSAEGLLRLLCADDAVGVVNLGSGRRRSVQDAFDAIAACVPGMIVTEVPSDLPVESSEADVGLLEALTGWRPPTSLEEGIRAIVAYERGESA